MIYKVWDESGCSANIEADSLQEACKEYCEDGSWGDDFRSKTQVIPTWGCLEGEGEGEFTAVVLDPAIPECECDDHSWVQDSVSANGGYTRVEEHCSSCLATMITKCSVSVDGTGNLYDIVSFGGESCE